MSKVAIQGNASGTGTLTVAAPNTNSDYTLTLPTQTGTIVSTDASGNVGIGTSSPSGKLHVEGGTENAIIGSSTRKLYFRADSGGMMLGTGAVQAGNGIYFNEASNFLYFQTNSTERMRIDSSGRVTMPYQVCCFAYSTTGQTIPNTTGTKVQMNTVGYETGVTFDTSNYRFTAPVSGKYLITVAVSMDNGPNLVHAGIFLNGSGSGAPSSGLPNGYLQSGNGNTGTTQVGVINTRIMKLNSGDYIEAYTYHSSGVSKTLDNSGRNYISIVFLG